MKSVIMKFAVTAVLLWQIFLYCRKQTENLKITTTGKGRAAETCRGLTRTYEADNLSRLIFCTERKHTFAGSTGTG